MPKFPALKPKQIIKALKNAGFYEIRSKGSHLQLKKGNLLVTVPLHNTELKMETLKSILRQSKLTANEILELL